MTSLSSPNENPQRPACCPKSSILQRYKVSKMDNTSKTTPKVAVQVSNVNSLGAVWFNNLLVDQQRLGGGREPLALCSPASTLSDSAASSFTTRTTEPTKKRKRNLTEEKRIQRNAREQARSNRLSQQFECLRTLLTNAGIIVPKGTKGSVLRRTMEYIQALQKINDTTER